MERRKILILGGKGQLGSTLTKVLKENSCELGSLPKFLETAEILSLGSKDLDITKKEEVLEFFKKEKPYAAINCAAYTDVDGCEDNKEVAFLVNSLGPRNLAIACEEEKSKFFHISTDYVFDGETKGAKIEFDLINPQSIYGRSKALGEQYAMSFCRRFFILRTAWLYGENGNNFVKTIVNLAKKREEIDVVDDQIGTPTNVLDLSYVIANLLETDEYGIYHCTAKGECSWFFFAKLIVRCFGIDVVVRPCSTEQFKRKAKRPKFSTLENFMLKKTIGDLFRDWEEAFIAFSKKFKNLF